MKIAIAGAGKLGLRIAEILKGGDHSITLIDKDEELMQRLSSLDLTTVTGNAKEASLLEEIRIGDYDYLIAATDRDEKNIVIGTIAKSLGVSKVIARIRDPEYDHQDDLVREIFGIDYIVNPERSVAKEINKYLVEKYSFIGGILNAEKIAMLEITIDKIPGLIGGTIGDARARMRSEGMALSAISKNGKLLVLEPDDDYEIEEYDVLYTVGARDVVSGAAEKYIEKERYTDIRRVMIAGGGKVGYYLAHMLEEFGASVKIVELDMQRCQYLSSHLQTTLVLNGDATDISLLEEENYSDMDAFVSVTGFDEENLLLALMAKCAGIEDVIAKISRENFETLVTHMGVDMVLNPIDISANYIVRCIKDEAVLSSEIIQGQVEFVLVEVDRGMSAQGKDIKSLELPRGLVIVALQRDGEVILPDDDTEIVEGDHLAILSALTESFDLEKLLKVKQSFFS